MMSVDALQNIMADHQFEVTRDPARGYDLDPSDVYAAIFRKLGWRDESIAAAIEDCDTLLEQRLLDATSPSVGYAKMLLREGIQTVRARMDRELATEAGASPYAGP
jgi:hypothetical protein